MLTSDFVPYICSLVRRGAAPTLTANPSCMGHTEAVASVQIGGAYGLNVFLVSCMGLRSGSQKWSQGGYHHHQLPQCIGRERVRIRGGKGGGGGNRREKIKTAPLVRPMLPSTQRPQKSMLDTVSHCLHQQTPHLLPSVGKST